ncbi:MAG: metallophosphoesterase [Leeuwenhoekiella sp.]
MNKNNIVLTLLVFLLISSCATFNVPKYRDEDRVSIYPTDKQVDKRFFLIGDGGLAKNIGDKAVGIQALEAYLKQNGSAADYAIFLGDNIYPVGMPPKESKERPLMEYRLDVQYDAFEDFDGEIIFIPGNHDWYNSGLDGLKREEEYLEQRANGADVVRPSNGCPLESVSVNENIQMILLDTQWYLADWDANPEINDKCQIKTREKFMIELEGELKKHQQKTILITMHHPMYTNGVHGGKFALDKHLYPSSKKVPLPILASLVTQIRTQGGVSRQDRFNEMYNSLMKRIKVLVGDEHRVVFASGHEHSLQYIEHEEIKQIVSGSASKESYATLGGDGLFAYPGQGFAIMDVFDDQSVWVRYFGKGKDGQAQMLYQHEIYGPLKLKDYSAMPSQFPQTVEASVYSIEDTQKTAFYESIWGTHYREVYGKKVTASVALLDTLYGGLEVIRPGGGHQTISLRLKDANGREYNMRALKKSAVQFVQKAVLNENEVQEDLKNSLPETLIQDFYTAAHPYGAFAIPTLSSAVQVLNTNPKLYYVPKQPALGIFNETYGDELYMIVERPAEEFDGATFNYPDDIESTDDILDKIRSDEENVIDEQAYIRARMFDMLIGDWDRHNDQWRWAEFKNQNGKDVFVPIPRDRDQVFTNFDGTFLNVVRTLFGGTKKFQVYDEKLDDIKWFNNAGIKLDMALAQQSTRDVWVNQAEYIQKNITDSTIDAAFTALPPEVNKGETIDNIKKKLRARRDGLVEIANEYYDYFVKLQYVNGTDKDDYFEITRGDNQTTIKAWRIKGGEKADLLLDRTYYSKETDQIWIYGLDDDDVFVLMEDKGNNPISLRIIGGQNNDVYRIKNGRKVKVYDYESRPNTIEERGGANFRLTDLYDYNVYNYKKIIISNNVLLPALGFNPDDGISLGLSDVFTVNSFRSNPFSQQHKFKVGYYFATQGMDFNYSGEFAGIMNAWNLLLTGRFTTPSFAENFFGFGNETINPQDELGMDYNRVRTSFLEVSGGLVKRDFYGLDYMFKGLFQGIQVERNNGRITDSLDIIDENRKYFASFEGSMDYHSADNELAPTRGMDFETVAGYTYGLEDSDASFVYINMMMGFYNAISRNRKLVLKTTAQTQLRYGDNYEFYQAAKLGQNTGLRGYRFERFTGERSFAASGDLRYAFNTFSTGFLPLQIGVFGGYDIGRVWLRDDFSDVWHDSYGVGFWVNSADALSGTFNFFTADEGLRVSFGLGFNF